MTKRIYKLFLAGFIFCLTLLVFATFGPEVYGQESSGVKLQPAIIEDVAEPGGVFHSVLNVTNVSDSEKTFYFVARDITGLTPEGSPIFAEDGDKNEYTLSSWIVPGIPSVYLLPDETKEIPFSVFVPKDASPGGHFAGLFVSLEPPKVEGVGTGIGYQVASIISLQIAGDITDDARIREFATGKFVYTKSEVDFRTVVENLGNIIVRARGPLEITDIFGKKVATLIVNESGAVVLPESNREFKAVWTGEGLNIGRYQAVLSLVYGNEGKKTITATTSFWVLPLNFILIVLAGIIAFIIIFFTITHIYIRNKLAKMNQGAGAGYGQKNSSPRGMILSLVSLAVVGMLIIVLMVFFA